MTPQELFDMLMAWPQPTRTEVLNHLENMTRNYDPERVEVLLLDFADMLFQWQCNETCNQAKSEYDERERQRRSEYEKRYLAYEVQLNLANYALAIGTNEPIEWPEELEPYEPFPFSTPMPGTIAENIHIPGMYNYAVKALKRKCPEDHPKEVSVEEWDLPSELDTDRAKKYFARAIEAGYLQAGNKWVFGGARGALVRLGYFVERVFCPTNTEELPEQAINRLFGVNRIGSAITQLHNAKKPQKWRAEIDRNIFFD